MRNQDLPAMPLDAESNKLLEEGYWYCGWGNTKLEDFTKAAMAGLLASGALEPDGWPELATEALEQAIATLDALEKWQGK